MATLRRVFISLFLFAFLLSQFLIFIAPTLAASRVWNFNSSADYTYNTSKIDVTAGQAQLRHNSATAWYDTGWSRRAPITINNTGNASALTNYQVSVAVTFDADMQTDFDDIRFTTSDGTTIIDYWRKTYTASTSATFWAKVPSIAASANTTIYMYYGNASVSTTSSGRNTMLVFEDQSDLPAGTLKNDALYDPVNGYFRLTRAVNSLQGQLEQTPSPGGGFETNFDFWTGGGNGADAVWFYAYNTTTPSAESAATGGYTFAYDEFDDQIQVNYNGGSVTTAAQASLDNSTWHTAQVIHYGTVVQMSYDGSQKINYTDSSRDQSGTLFGFGARTGGLNQEHRVRNMWMRLYSNPDPSASVGSEEAFAFATDNPTIQPTSSNALSFTSLSGFSETATKNGGEIKYQISNDSGTTWYWYNSGWTTTVAGYTEASTASVINTNIATFPVGSGSLLFKAYLNSNGSQLVKLDAISLTFTKTNTLIQSTTSDFNTSVTHSSTQASNNSVILAAGGSSAASWWSANYSYRAPITITTTPALATGYSIKIASAASNPFWANSQSDADDVRVIYWNGSTNTELDREVITFSSSAYEIWFKTQAAIAASSSSVGDYLIYYGNSSVAAPSVNKSNVYLLYDDFSGSSVDTSKWTATTSTQSTGTATITVAGGVVTLNVNKTSAGGNMGYTNLKSNSTTLPSNFAVETRAKIKYDANNYGWVEPIAGTTTTAGGSESVKEGGLFQAVNTASLVLSSPSVAITNDSYYYIQTYFVGTAVSAYYSTTGFNEASSLGTATATNARNIVLIGRDWTAGFGSTTQRIETLDYIRVRARESSEPTVSAGSAERQYAASGTFTSSIIDAASTGAQWGTAAWNTSGTGTITIKIRTSNAADMSGATAWGTVSTATSGNDISANTGVTDGQRYIQYQAALSTASQDVTPSFDHMAINYQNYPNAPSSLGGIVDGSWTGNSTPDLTFTLADPDSGDTVKYQIQVDDTSDFSSPVVDYTAALAAQGAKTFTVGQAAGSGSYTTGSAGQTLSNNTSYYWRVKNIDNSAASSANSIANSGAVAFKVDSTGPSLSGSPTFFSITTTGMTVTSPIATDAESGLHATPYEFDETTSGASFDRAFGASTYAASGLSVNTQYTFRTRARDAVSNNSSYSSSASKYTLANTPTVPTVTATSTTTVSVVIAVNSNPSATEFAIQEAGSGNYVQADGTLGAAAAWQTYTNWGGASGKSVTGLSSNTAYTFKVKARNGDSTETTFSTTASATTSAKTANTPGTPTLSRVSPSSLSVVIAQNSNVSTVTYAILETTTNKYVQADGTLGATAAWRTFTAWGDSSGQTITGLFPNTQYTLKSKAKSGDNIESDFSSTVSLYTNANVPANLAGTAASTSQIDLTWGLNSNPSGTTFELFNITSNKTVFSGVAVSYSDKDLSSNKEYQYKARGQNKEAVYTPYTDVISVKTKEETAAATITTPTTAATTTTTTTTTTPTPTETKPAPVKTTTPKTEAPVLAPTPEEPKSSPSFLATLVSNLGEAGAKIVEGVVSTVASVGEALAKTVLAAAIAVSQGANLIVSAVSQALSFIFSSLKFSPSTEGMVKGAFALRLPAPVIFVAILVLGLTLLVMAISYFVSRAFGGLAIKVIKQSAHISRVVLPHFRSLDLSRLKFKIIPPKQLASKAGTMEIEVIPQVDGVRIMDKNLEKVADISIKDVQLSKDGALSFNIEIKPEKLKGSLSWKLTRQTRGQYEIVGRIKS